MKSPARAIIAGEEELGEQKRCPRCCEWWPASTEFFPARPGGGLSSWCQACRYEVRAIHMRATRLREKGLAGLGVSRHT